MEISELSTSKRDAYRNGRLKEKKSEGERAGLTAGLVGEEREKHETVSGTTRESFGEKSERTNSDTRRTP